MSEVSRLLHQIEMEYEAARRGLIEYAVVSRHDFIAEKFKQVDMRRIELTGIIGEEEANTRVCALYDEIFKDSPA